MAKNMALQTEARIIADSIHNGHRLTTMEVTIHRFVLAEFNTHRILSRNSASSRAIPVEKQLERIGESPAFPISWPCEQPGMSGGTELEGDDLAEAKALFDAVHAFTLKAVGDYVAEHPDKAHRLHKSVTNRLLEPFMWHTVVVSSTEWTNFFGLRCSPLAQPEIRVAAEMMRDVYQASTPVEVNDGQWHLPYITDEEKASLDIEDLCKISVIRCARVSSLHAGKVGDYDSDYALFERLTSAVPPHASPLEHVATPAISWGGPTLGNFDGWHQFRHTAGAYWSAAS